MGATRTEHYSNKQNEMATMLKALSHPARIVILEHLLKVNSCICGDIVDELPLAQPTVSQHLRELKESGLITGDINGNSVCYCIDVKNWRRMQKHTTELFEKLNTDNCKC